MPETYQFLIDGQWRTSEETMDVVNPFNNEAIGAVYRPSAQDVEDAIQSSVRTFEETPKMRSYQRSDILKKAAAGINERKE